MPTYSKHYNLQAFVAGDPYSAEVDQNRFYIIDTQVGFISSVLGNGRITGWAITDATAGGVPQVQVSYGQGLIDKYVARTFGDMIVETTLSTTSYIYIQRKPGLFGLVGPFCSPTSFAWADAVAPAVPAGLALSDITKNSLTADWDDNAEADFDHYILERTDDAGVTWSTIASPTVSTYADNGLTQHTVYSYRVSAVDVSGNNSGPGVVVGTTTLQELVPASLPSYFTGFTGDGEISFIWGENKTPFPDEYILRIQELDYEGNPVGSYTDYNLDIDDHNFTIDGLANTTLYSCTLYSVNANGVLSDGFNVKLSPQVNLGPAEVENVSITSSSSNRNPNSLMFDLEWTEGIDAYKPPAIKYAITLIENGYKESDSVYVYENIQDFSIDTFVQNGICYPILSKTDYIIRIQGVDEDGDISNGIIQRIYTGISVSPVAPSSISANLDNNGLEFTWDNNAPYLDHNLVTVTDRDLEAESDTDIITSVDNGPAKSYVVSYVNLTPNHRYIIKITAVDVDGNTSGEITYYYTVLPIDYSDVWGGAFEGDRPPQVDEVSAFGGDGAVLLIWGEIAGVSVDEYHIWRADFIRNEYYVASDFSLVASVGSDVRAFVDYSVTNGTRSTYFITMTDTFGNTTLNPVDDDYANHLMVHALPIDGKSGLTAPTNVTLTNPAGFNALLVWTAVTGDFDCYEIYTSVGDLVSWTKVASVDIGTVTYTHPDAFVHGDGNYFYMVRAARNEGRLLVRSSTANPPIHSLLLAEVVSNGDSVTSIEDEARELYQLESYITEKVTPWVNEHVHNITNAYDKRIDLSANVTILEWQTDDQQTYVTMEQIVGTAESSGSLVTTDPSYYVVKIDEVITDIPYTVIPLTRTIIFDYPTGSDNLSVELGGIDEVTGTIDEKRLISFDSSQSESGRLHPGTLPGIPHDSRRYERLIPLQLPTETTNGYTYNFYQNNHTANEQSIGDSITFYDFIEILSGNLIAATSRGLLISEDEGESWSDLRTTNNVIHTLFYDPVVGKYLGLANGVVYISDTGDSWATTNGLDNVSIVRSAASDGDYLYITTDLGVFVLKNDSLGDLLTWEEVPFYSGQTTDTYGILYDSYESRLVISSEVGIFQSTNDGDSWHLTQEIQEPAPVWAFVENSGYFFALTDYGIWRKHHSATNFTKIAYFDADIARKMEVFEGRLVISTDEGIMVSNDNYNIYIDTDISFETDSFYLINFSAKITPVTAMKEIGSILYIGTDERVYAGADFDEFELLYKQSSTIIPTVYINDVEQVVGFYYNIVKNTVYFDRRISSLASVTIANQYSNFKATNGKWIDENYDADVMIYGRAGLIAFLVNGYPPINQLNAVSFDTFTDDNSNAAIADSYVVEYNDAVTRLSEILGGATLATGETTKSSVENCVYWYYKTYSQAYGNVIYGDLKTIDSHSYLVVDNIMYLSDIAEDFLRDFVVVETMPDFAFTSNLTTNITANASDGSFSFVDTGYNKYDTMYVDISGIGITETTTYTHKELEDIFETYNSGMPYLLSEVNQVNELKEGLFLERDAILDPVPVLQTKYHIPFDRSWYSVLDSTVDYSEQINCVNLGVSFFYPTVVNYYAASGKVFVGYNRGLVSIDIDTLDVTSINFNDNQNEYVNDIFVYSGTLYVLTDMRLYASSDYGTTWAEQEVYGLSGLFRRMWSFNNMLLFATNQGIFWKYDSDNNWERVSLLSNVEQFITDKGVFALAGNKLYYSENGYQWAEKGSFGSVTVTQVQILNTLAFLPTNKGLRHDGTSRFGDSLGTTLIDLEGNTEVSVELKINSIATNSDNNQYIAGGKNGYYYTWDLGSGTITKTASGMDSIYKIIYVNGKYWMFGNDSLLRVSNLPMPIKISTGVPF